MRRGRAERASQLASCIAPTSFKPQRHPRLSLFLFLSLALEKTGARRDARELGERPEPQRAAVFFPVREG